MADAPQEYDSQTLAKLEKLAGKRAKLEAKIGELESGPDEFTEAEQKAYQAIQTKLETLDDEEETITKDAEVRYAEATKAVGTAFLLLDPDGRVRREYRIPRSRRSASANGDGVVGDGPSEAPKPLTPDDLKEPQLAVVFTHQALAVREALLKDASARKRVLAMILHARVRSDALSVRHEANGTTLHAGHGEGFHSTALDALSQKRSELDPLYEQPYTEDHAAYDALKGIPDKQVNALVDLLTVECITAHLQHKTALVWRLAEELGVDIRRYWRPDEKWLASYQKIQLAALIVELRGPVHTPAESKKKSELVAELAKLFTDAAEGHLEDAGLAARMNAWLPFNLREVTDKVPDRAGGQAA